MNIDGHKTKEVILSQKNLRTFLLKLRFLNAMQEAMKAAFDLQGSDAGAKATSESSSSAPRASLVTDNIADVCRTLHFDREKLDVDELRNNFTPLRFVSSGRSER